MNESAGIRSPLTPMSVDNTSQSQKTSPVTEQENEPAAITEVKVKIEELDSKIADKSMGLAKLNASKAPNNAEKFQKIAKFRDELNELKSERTKMLVQLGKLKEEALDQKETALYVRNSLNLQHRPVTSRQVENAAPKNEYQAFIPTPEQRREFQQAATATVKKSTPINVPKTKQWEDTYAKIYNGIINNKSFDKFSNEKKLKLLNDQKGYINDNQSNIPSDLKENFQLLNNYIQDQINELTPKTTPTSPNKIETPTPQKTEFSRAFKTPSERHPTGRVDRAHPEGIKDKEFWTRELSILNENLYDFHTNNIGQLDYFNLSKEEKTTLLTAWKNDITINKTNIPTNLYDEFLNTIDNKMKALDLMPPEKAPLNQKGWEDTFKRFESNFSSENTIYKKLSDLEKYATIALWRSFFDKTGHEGNQTETHYNSFNQAIKSKLDELNKKTSAPQTQTATTQTSPKETEVIWNKAKILELDNKITQMFKPESKLSIGEKIKTIKDIQKDIQDNKKNIDKEKTTSLADKLSKKIEGLLVNLENQEKLEKKGISPQNSIEIERQAIHTLNKHALQALHQYAEKAQLGYAFNPFKDFLNEHDDVGMKNMSKDAYNQTLRIHKDNLESVFKTANLNKAEKARIKSIFQQFKLLP